MLLWETFDEVFCIELDLAEAVSGRRFCGRRFCGRRFRGPEFRCREQLMCEAEFEFCGSQTEPNITKCLGWQCGAEFIGELQELVGERASAGAGIEGKPELFLIGEMAAKSECGGFDGRSGDEEFELAQAESKFGFGKRCDLIEQFGDASGSEGDDFVPPGGGEEPCFVFAAVGEEDFPAEFCGGIQGGLLFAKADLACEVKESMAAELEDEIGISIRETGELRGGKGRHRRNGKFIGSQKGVQDQMQESVRHADSVPTLQGRLSTGAGD